MKPAKRFDDVILGPAPRRILPDWCGWRDPTVPKREWSCVNVEDLGEDNFAVCRMCTYEKVRYLHFMEHPRYSDDMPVGCVCAGKMEGDPEAARDRERRARNESARRRNWLSRNWRTSAKGNEFLNTDGFNVVVFRQRGGWGFCVSDRHSEEKQFSKKTYTTCDEAKLGAFMKFMRFLR